MKKITSHNITFIILCLVLGITFLPYQVEAQIKEESINMSMSDDGELTVYYQVDRSKIKARQHFMIEALHILHDGELTATIARDALRGTLDISKGIKGEKQIKYTLPKDSEFIGNQVELAYKAVDKKKVQVPIERLKLWDYMLPGIGEWTLEKKQVYVANRQVSEKNQEKETIIEKEPNLINSIVPINETPAKVDHKTEPKAKLTQWIPTIISLFPLAYGIGQWKNAQNTRLGPDDKPIFDDKERDKFARNATIAFGVAGTIYAADILHLFAKNRKFVKKQKKQRKRVR